MYNVYCIYHLYMARGVTQLLKSFGLKYVQCLVYGAVVCSIPIIVSQIAISILSAMNFEFRVNNDISTYVQNTKYFGIFGCWMYFDVSLVAVVRSKTQLYNCWNNKMLSCFSKFQVKERITRLCSGKHMSMAGWLADCRYIDKTIKRTLFNVHSVG